MKNKTLIWIISASLFLSLGFAGVMIYLKVNNLYINLTAWKQIGIITGISLGAIGILMVVTMLAIRLIDKIKRKPDYMQEYIVDADDAFAAWKAAFIINTGIPCNFINGDRRNPVLSQRTHLEIRNEKTYPDPSGQTSDKFRRFEAIARAGDRPGAHTVTIRTDRNVEYIMKNWNEFIIDHKPMNTLRQSTEDFNMSSAREHEQRMQSKRLALYEKYDPEDMKTIDAMIPTVPQNTQAQNQPKEEVSPVQEQASSGEEQEKSTTEQFKDRYRREQSESQ